MTFRHFEDWLASEKAKADAWEAMTEEEKVFHKLKTPPPPKHSRANMPLIRRVIPGIIAQELVGVQPMSPPTGLISTLKVKHGTDKKDEE